MTEIKFKEYVLLYLKDNPSRVPSIRFWVATLLIINVGFKIKMSNAHYLTAHDCFVEMEDCLQGKPVMPRLYWYIFQRKKYYNEFTFNNIDITRYRNF